MKIIGKIKTSEKIIVPYVRESLERFRDYCNTQRCDICNTNHYRSELYIVEMDDNSEKVCGKGCLIKMFGKDETQEAIDVAKRRGEEIAKFCYVTFTMLGYAYDLIQTHGFVSRKEEREQNAKSTAQAILEQFWGKKPHKTSDEKVTEIIEHFKNIPDCDDTFIMNYKSLANAYHCSDDSLSMIALMANAYIKHEEQMKLRSKFSDKYIGEEKQKIEKQMPVRVVSIRQSDNYFSNIPQKNIIFATEENSVLMWRTTSEPDLKENDSVTLSRFTVKNHFQSKWYGSVTSIIRPKFA